MPKDRSRKPAPRVEFSTDEKDLPLHPALAAFVAAVARYNARKTFSEKPEGEVGNLPEASVAETADPLSLHQDEAV